MLGEKIKSYRLRRKLTLDELADNLNKNYPGTVNFNKGKLSKWENDKEEPKLSSIRILADYYGIAIDDFYSENNSQINTIDRIYNKLESSRQVKVYKFAEKELDEQNSNILDFKQTPPAEDVETFAAHTNDPNENYSDEEKAKISKRLKAIRDKHLNID